VQTFLPCKGPILCANILDDKRLGKQRVEAIQILYTLLGFTDGWLHHPAVKMWKGYEPFLCYSYLRAMLNDWTMRGFDNTRCNEHFKILCELIPDSNIVQPWWLIDLLCLTHRSKLIQKRPDIYRPIFPNTPDNLEYWWPV
jgi:hypothetical protein